MAKRWAELKRESQQQRVELVLENLIALLRQLELRLAKKCGKGARKFARTESMFIGKKWDEIRVDILYKVGNFFRDAPDDEISEAVNRAESLGAIMSANFWNSLREFTSRIIIPMISLLSLAVLLLYATGCLGLEIASKLITISLIVVGALCFCILLSRIVQFLRKGKPTLRQLNHKDYKDFISIFEARGLSENEKKLERLVSEFKGIRDDLFRDAMKGPLDSAQIFDRFISTFTELSQTAGDKRLEELSHQARCLRADLAKRIKNEPDKAKELTADFGRILDSILFEIAAELQKPEND